jgi:hypothetical protein
MQRKLTVTIDEQVYLGLHTVVGRRRISRFVESIVGPHVLKAARDAEYRRMAADADAEAEALQWIESVVGDVTDEEG